MAVFPELVTKTQNSFRSAYHYSSADDRYFTQREGQGEQEATHSTVGGLTFRIIPKYKSKTKTTIIDISAGYPSIHSKYVQFNNLSFMQTLVRLSAFEC